MKIDLISEPRQSNLRQFAAAYLDCFDSTEAALRTGYNPAKAAMIGRANIVHSAVLELLIKSLSERIELSATENAILYRLRSLDVKIVIYDPADPRLKAKSNAKGRNKQPAPSPKIHATQQYRPPMSLFRRPKQVTGPWVGSCVYFIQMRVPSVPSGPVKIGLSTEVSSRLAQLTSGSPYPLDIVCIFPGRDLKELAELEYRFHLHFADQQLQGEWFQLSEQELGVLRRPRRRQ